MHDMKTLRLHTLNNVLAVCVYSIYRKLIVAGCWWDAKGQIQMLRDATSLPEKLPRTHSFTFKSLHTKKQGWKNFLKI